jgi:hypothetical protein
MPPKSQSKKNSANSQPGSSKNANSASAKTQSNSTKNASNSTKKVPTSSSSSSNKSSKPPAKSVKFPIKNVSNKAKEPESEPEIVEHKNEKPKVDNSLYRYLCCFCCFKYRSRKLVRAREKELKRIADELALAEFLRNQPPPAKQIEIDAATQLAIKQDIAARKLQRIACGYIGRCRAKHRKEEVMNEVNAYWLEVKRLRDEEAWRKAMIIAARKAVRFVRIFMYIL